MFVPLPSSSRSKETTGKVLISLPLVEFQSLLSASFERILLIVSFIVFPFIFVFLLIYFYFYNRDGILILAMTTDFQTKTGYLVEIVPILQDTNSYVLLFFPV